MFAKLRQTHPVENNAHDLRDPTRHTRSKVTLMIYVSRLFVPQKRLSNSPVPIER